MLGILAEMGGAVSVFAGIWGEEMKAWGSRRCGVGSVSNDATDRVGERHMHTLLSTLRLILDGNMIRATVDSHPFYQSSTPGLLPSFVLFSH
jgi:hypothetical protein